ncbi:MAG TPA: SRPBCC domain-containing protein, partial [Myxococcota bacterium]|nr:SRPBCC domain-containing protein [Myxococcota bacterium]
MSLQDTTAPAQTDALSFVFELKHRPEKVWRALTDPTLLREWLLPTVGLQLGLGSSFTFQTQPMPGWDGTVFCRILELHEGKRLSYSWVVGEMLDTVVTFTLEPTPTGT